MAAIPKKLGIRYLLDPDQAKAATEAQDNLQRLVLAGQLETAYAVGLLLTAPGPWRLTPRSAAASYWLAQTMNWLCARLQRDCPAIDSEPARSAAQAADWVASRAGLAAALPVAPWPVTSGKTWDKAGISTLLGTVRPDRYGSEFNAFREPATQALRGRLQSRLGLKGASVLPEFDALTSAEIADAIEQGIAIAFPRSFGEDAGVVPLLAAMLDLLDGRRDAAIARLARFLPVMKTPALEHEYRFWTPYADLLASRAFGPALGITDAGAAAYRDALATRTPYTLAASKPRPWKIVLKDYAARLVDDAIEADALVAGLQSGEPVPKALLARARKGNPLNASASEAAITALETRLGAALPPSYREFLATSDGLLVPDRVSLLPAADVDWLRTLDPDTIAAWNEGAEDASDADYDTYGADQDCIHMRPRHLHDALQVSANTDGDVVLLVPGVRFGEEWEAWFLGAKNPGAYRFRSFRDLMEQHILVEQGA